MSNSEVNSLPSLEVEHHQVKEVLRCLFHTVIFNRALGLVTPRDVQSELFDITYIQCGDPAVTKQVEHKISQVCDWIAQRQGKKAQVTLSFYEKKIRQTWLGGNQTERLFWEHWTVELSLVDLKTSQEQQTATGGRLLAAKTERAQQLHKALQASLIAIVTIVNEKKEHIPPVTNQLTLTFPFDISITGEGSSGGFADSWRKMLMHAAPPPVLT